MEKLESGVSLQTLQHHASLIFFSHYRCRPLHTDPSSLPSTAYTSPSSESSARLTAIQTLRPAICDRRKWVQRSGATAMAIS